MTPEQAESNREVLIDDETMDLILDELLLDAERAGMTLDEYLAEDDE